MKLAGDIRGNWRRRAGVGAVAVALLVASSSAVATATRAAAASPAGGGAALLTVKSNCAFPVWLQAMSNHGAPPVPPGDVVVSLPQRGASHAYAALPAAWAGRFWPRLGCANPNGTDCASGEAVPPCPPRGCEPPADTKFEFNFASSSTWFDVSLVDGYSLGVAIAPSRQDPSSGCVATQCALSLADCPANETLGLGSLRVPGARGGVVQCLSPCKRWNWPAPLGMGRPEDSAPGVDLCCPTPPVSPAQCRGGPVVDTEYVRLVHRECPSAYAYAYDDAAGLHTCPSGTTFEVTLCP